MPAHSALKWVKASVARHTIGVDVVSSCCAGMETQIRAVARYADALYRVVKPSLKNSVASRICRELDYEDIM